MFLSPELDPYHCAEVKRLDTVLFQMVILLLKQNGQSIKSPTVQEVKEKGRCEAICKLYAPGKAVHRK